MVATEKGIYFADFCNGSMTAATEPCGVIYLLTTD
jgi:hypothetical protein